MWKKQSHHEETQSENISTKTKNTLSEMKNKLQGKPRLILEIIGIMLILTLSISLSGKASQEEYHTLQSKYTELQEDYNDLQTDYDSISSKYKALSSELKTTKTTLEQTLSDYEEYQEKMQVFDNLSEDDLTTVAAQVDQIIANKKAEEQAAAEAQAAAQAQAEAAAQANQQAQGQMVWIPRTGSKYHNNSSCSNMKNPSQVSLSEAQSRGYEPCKKCY